MESSTVEIEQYIFKAWDMGLSGASVVDYVCSMTNQPNFVVEPVLNSLIDRMCE